MVWLCIKPPILSSQCCGIRWKWRVYHHHRKANAESIFWSRKLSQENSVCTSKNLNLQSETFETSFIYYQGCFQLCVCWQNSRKTPTSRGEVRPPRLKSSVPGDAGTYWIASSAPPPRSAAPPSAPLRRKQASRRRCGSPASPPGAPSRSAKRYHRLLRQSAVTYRLAVRDLVCTSVRNLGLQLLVVVHRRGVHLHLDVATHILDRHRCRFRLHSLHHGGLLCNCLCLNLSRLHLLHLLHLFILLLPLPLFDLGLNFRAEVVKHLFLVLPVHVEERGGCVISRPAINYSLDCSVTRETGFSTNLEYREECTGTLRLDSYWQWYGAPRNRQTNEAIDWSINAEWDFCFLLQTNTALHISQQTVIQWRDRQQNRTTNAKFQSSVTKIIM